MLNNKKAIFYICSNCGWKNPRIKPKHCPKCKSTKFNKRKERRLVTK
jgi:predicted Zn-ribbon and HTH transcriptional regulator